MRVRPVGENCEMRGDKRMLRGVHVGHRERSGAAIFLTPDGVKRGTRVARLDRVFSATCIGVPWQLRPEAAEAVQSCAVLVAEADQGVAPVIVMPPVPRVNRRRYITTRDLAKYEHTDECQTFTPLAAGMHNAKGPHDDRCRHRSGELMADDDDQRPGERVSSRAVPEAEGPRPEGGEEMDVTESTVRVGGPPARPAPTYQEGVTSSASSRARRGKAKMSNCWRRWRRTQENISTLTLRCAPAKLAGWQMSQWMQQPPRQSRCRRRKSP